MKIAPALHRSGQTLCAALLGVLLSACIIKPRATDTLAADDYQRIGRFALRSEAVTGEQQAVQGGFVWRDDGRTLRLDLSNPLGTTLARVEVDSVRAILTRSDGTQTVAATPDALLVDVLGSPIPVASLRDWLHGRLGQRPAQDLTHDADNRPESFQQDGWQVRLSRYDTLGPRLLRVKREQSGEAIDVRLVID